MILASLVDYYDALAAKDKVPRPGWAEVKVSYELVIDNDGVLKDILPLEGTMRLPERDRNSSDVTSCFLCDDKRYIFGCPEREAKAFADKAKKALRVTKEKYRTILSSADCAEATALLRFFETWNAQKHLWLGRLSGIGTKENWFCCKNMKGCNRMV